MKTAEKIQLTQKTCTEYQLQIFNHEFLDNFILGKYQLVKLIFE